MATAKRKPETPESELARLTRDIARLNGQLEQIDANDQTLKETVEASQDALNQALRQYGADGSEALLERVQDSEDRLQAARTRLATSGSSKSVLLADRAALKDQADGLAAALKAEIKVTAIRRMKAQLADVRGAIETLVVEYVALSHLVEGKPCGSASLKEFASRELRTSAQERVRELSEEWNHGI